MKATKARYLHLQPLARIVDWATSAVSPEIMGIEPVSAVTKLVKITGIPLSEIGLFELNEAFASQALAVMQKLDPERVNVIGGAIALGHPVGSTGAKIITTLLHEMHTREVRYGVATLCAGGGQGIAMMIERI